MGLKGKQKFNNFYNQPYSKKKSITLENFHEDINASKFFSLIYLNEFCFDWDLKKRHNLTQTEINKLSKLLNELGLVSFRLYSELDHIRQDVIRETTPDFNDLFKRNDKVFCVTNFCKQNGKDLFNKIIDTHKHNEGFFDFIKRINELHVVYKTKIQEINEIEKNDDVRLIDFRNGVVAEKETFKKREEKIELLKYSKMFQVSNQSSTSLVTKSDRKNYLAEIKQAENNELKKIAKQINLKKEVESFKNEFIRPFNTKLRYDSELQQYEQDPTLTYDRNLVDRNKKELKEDYYGEYKNTDAVSSIKQDMINKTANNNEFINVLGAKVINSNDSKSVSNEDREKMYLKRCAERGLVK